MTPIDPVAALDEIAYLMERTLADPYRVRAFRAAARTIAGLSPQDYDRRARTGTWRELPGVGHTSATVISEAVAGEVPDRLATLRAEARPLASGGEALLAQLRGDLHTHTDASDGSAPAEESRKVAERLGYEYLAITDHSPRLRVANGLNRERLAAQLDALEVLNREAGPRLLGGIEVDILPDGELDQEPDLLDRLGVVVASVHS